MSARDRAGLWACALAIALVVHAALLVAVAPAAPWWFSLVTGVLLVAASEMGVNRERARAERKQASR